MLLDKSITSGAPRVIVIGTGIVGLCIAWSLRKRGFDVTIFDSNPPGSGCSSGNAGALSAGSVAPLAMPGVLRSAPSMLFDKRAALHIPFRYWFKAMPWLVRFALSARRSRVAEISDALAQLHQFAIERHREILVELGATDLIRAEGQLYLYRNQAQRQKDDAVWRLRKDHGVRVEQVDRAGIEALEPSVGSDYQIGLFLPDQGMSINPQRHAATIADGLRARGACFVNEAVRALIVEGKSVLGVETDSNSHRAEIVVVAAGAWSARLLQPLGYRIPLESQRGYHIDLPATGVTLTRPIIPADRKVFITPMDFGLRVAGTVEFGGLEAPPTPSRALLLLDDLAAVVPRARTERREPIWMGHRPCLPDSLPVLGPSDRYEGLWFGFGHGHLGLTGSASTGDLIARAIARERPNVDLAPFSATRFKSFAC